MPASVSCAGASICWLRSRFRHRARSAVSLQKGRCCISRLRSTLDRGRRRPRWWRQLEISAQKQTDDTHPSGSIQRLGLPQRIKWIICLDPISSAAKTRSETQVARIFRSPLVGRMCDAASRQPTPYASSSRGSRAQRSVRPHVPSEHSGSWLCNLKFV